jgi:hypothetical protein
MCRTRGAAIMSDTTHVRCGTGCGIGRWAAACVTIISLAITACGSTAGARPPAPTATATPAFTRLPAFHDWRAAYLANGDTVHAVSLDGKQDLTGPTFTALDRARAWALSPDGRLLAYIDAPKWGNIVVANLSAGALTTTAMQAGQAGDLSWSPDGARLVADGTLDNVYGLYLVTVPGGTPTLVPGTGPGGSMGFSAGSGVIGWTDAAHVLVYGLHLPTAAAGRNGPAVTLADRVPRASGVALSAPLPSGPTQTALLDIATGKATVLPVPNGMGVIEIAPDGKLGLLASGCGAPCTIQPDLAVLDFATGQLRHLPRITAATGGQGGAWRPGTDVLAGLAGASETLNPWQSDQSALALLDLGSDSVTPIRTGFYPAGWSPDGQTLIVGAPITALGESGQSALYAMGSVASGVAPIPLTQAPGRFLGFIRTA